VPENTAEPPITSGLQITPIPTRGTGGGVGDFITGLEVSSILARKLSSSRR